MWFVVWRKKFNLLAFFCCSYSLHLLEDGVVGWLIGWLNKINIPIFSFFLSRCRLSSISNDYKLLIYIKTNYVESAFFLLLQHHCLLLQWLPDWLAAWREFATGFCDSIDGWKTFVMTNIQTYICHCH